MIGLLIQNIKIWWKQLWCFHGPWAHREIGFQSFRHCKKCGYVR